MRSAFIIAAPLFLFTIFPVDAEQTYKAGKFNCIFARLRAPSNEKNITLQSTKETPGNYYYEGVEFVVKVGEDNLVTVGGRFGDIKAKPYAEAYGKNSAWITILYGSDTGGIAVTGRCEFARSAFPWFESYQATAASL